jgi:thiosulfate/3-mercaptopyruvate sulfurtransferase
MKKLILLFSLVCTVFGVDIPTNHIIDTNWLEKNKNIENLVIIDTRKSEEYAKGHIENAVNIPKKMWFQGEVNGIKKYYNTPNQTQKLLQNAGIKEDSLVVFYSNGLNETDFADSASALWTLYMYGLKNTVILNGGFEKWKFENKKISTTLGDIEKSDIEIESFDKSVIASLDEIIEAILDEEIQISDARVAAFYLGTKGRDDLAKKGRIATAKLTPMIRHLKKENNYYVFNTSEESKDILYNSGFGVELDKALIVYCNAGHKARGLWFISKFLVGMNDVKVYDGSMVEYTRTDLPMEVGESF